MPASFDLQLAARQLGAEPDHEHARFATIFLFVEQVEWMLEEGGLEWSASRCDRSAEILYTWAEQSDFARPFVERPAQRSHVVGTIDFVDAVDAAPVARRPAGQRHRRHRALPQARPQPAAHRAVPRDRARRRRRALRLHQLRRRRTGRLRARLGGPVPAPGDPDAPPPQRRRPGRRPAGPGAAPRGRRLLRFWDNLLPALRAVYRVHAVDLPGHGPAATPLGATQAAPAAMARVVIAELEETGVVAPHLVGFSLGGWVALEMAASGYGRSVVALAPPGLWRRRPPSSLLGEPAGGTVLRLLDPLLPALGRWPNFVRLAVRGIVVDSARVSTTSCRSTRDRRDAVGAPAVRRAVWR